MPRTRFSAAERNRVTDELRAVIAGADRRAIARCGTAAGPLRVMLPRIVRPRTLQ